MRRVHDIYDVDFINNNGDNGLFLCIIEKTLFIYPVLVGFYFGMDTKINFPIILFLMIVPFKLVLCLRFGYYFR